MINLFSNLDLTSNISNKTLAITSLGLFSLATYLFMTSPNPLSTSVGEGMYNPLFKINNDGSTLLFGSDVSSSETSSEIDSESIISDTITDTTLTQGLQTENIPSSPYFTTGPIGPESIPSSPIGRIDQWTQTESLFTVDASTLTSPILPPQPEEEIIIIPDVEIPELHLPSPVELPFNIVPPLPPVTDPFSELFIETHSIHNHAHPLTPGANSPSPLTGSTWTDETPVIDVLLEHGLTHDEILEWVFHFSHVQRLALIDYYHKYQNEIDSFYLDTPYNVPFTTQTEVILNNAGVQATQSLVNNSVQATHDLLDIQTQTTPAVTDMGVQVTPSSSSLLDSSVQATSTLTDAGVQASNLELEFLTNELEKLTLELNLEVGLIMADSPISITDLDDYFEVLNNLFYL